MKTSKRNLMRTLSLMLALVMVIGMAPTAFATSGTDTGGGHDDHSSAPLSSSNGRYTYDSFVRRVMGASLATTSTPNYDDLIQLYGTVDGEEVGVPVRNENPDTGEYEFSLDGGETWMQGSYTPDGGGGGGGGGNKPNKPNKPSGGGSSSDDDDDDDGGGGGGGGGYDPPYYPPHYCTYSTSCYRYNSSQHKLVTTSCCGGSSTSYESHSWRYSYSDIGGEAGQSQHRTTQTCTRCGESSTYNEAHSEGAGYRCTKCNRVLAMDITWHYYDEHSPVTTVTKHYFYSKLTLAPARGRQDYKFTGWYTEWGGQGTAAKAGTKVMPGHTAHYYASWMAIVDLDYDFSAPIITVTRNPVSATNPTKNLTLTITAKDPEGNDHATPLQIEGETTWHKSPYVYTVTDSRPIMIVARDTENNTREFLVNVTNLDVAPPVVEGFTQDTTGWTNKPVTVKVEASDDQALHAQAYRWEFTPNSTGKATTGQWTATPSFAVSEAGKVRVQIRDAVGNTVWSDYYIVNNVDTTAPSLDPNEPYQVSTTGTVAASTGVTITLNLWDKPDSTSGMSSGLAAAPIKWVNIDGIFTANRTVTVHANGTYNVILRDAVGNESAPIPIIISNISTSEPVINQITATDVDGDVINPLLPSAGDKAPITITVDASFGAAGQPEKPYSYDGGMTWTSLNYFIVQENGEYTITIRDANGTQKSESIILTTIDNADPIVGMWLYKGQPDDWTVRFPGVDCTEKDYVWKLRIDAEDLGSGIDNIHTEWDNQDYDETQLPITFDVKNPGTYQITVTDKAGHQVQMEKVVQWTDLGESVYGPNPNVPVTTPDVGGTHSWDKGSAGDPFNANLEDLVFGPNGAYNTATGVFTPYPAGMEGIPVRFNAQLTRNKWGTATVSFNNKTYTAKFEGTDVTGMSTTLKDYNGVSSAKVLGTGNPIPGYSFIPISDITGDLKNARIRVTVREWNDEACTDLNKEGTENFYTSVQNSKPTITYTYNRATDEMTVVATSALAGIKTVTWSFDGGSANEYVNPFPLGDPAPSTVTLVATDNLGISNSLDVDVANLGLLGNTAGMPDTGSLSTDAIESGTSASHSSNRAADIYIIGGTRGNTDNVPGAKVYDNAFSGHAA